MSDKLIKTSIDPVGSRARVKAYQIAWFIGLIFYFIEYLVRSAPAVMTSELRDAFHVDAIGLSGIIGSYYYTYSFASLAAGLSLDKLGARYPVPAGLGILGLGCLLFAGSSASTAEIGRLLQGAGSAFAFTGAVYLASRGFSDRALATAVGVTQCVGMFGGWVGQVGVGPLTHGVIGWRVFWIGMSIACAALVVLLFVLTPVREKPAAGAPQSTGGILKPFAIVFSNPQSYLCGLVAGLLFVPTTVGIMIWGISFFQTDRESAYNAAVLTVGMAPLGWVVGCPLLGWLSDRLGRRKPVIAAGGAVMLVSIAIVAASQNLWVDGAALFAAGVGSGAAMIPYTIIKEVNPDEVKGSATGVLNFLTFSISAVVGPIFAHAVGAGLTTSVDRLAHFRESAWFWGITVLVAMGAMLALRETGHRNRTIGS
jgi:MFS family permease